MHARITMSTMPCLGSLHSSSPPRLCQLRLHIRNLHIRKLQGARPYRCVHVRAAASVTQDAQQLYEKLAAAEQEVRRAPPSEVTPQCPCMPGRMFLAAACPNTMRPTLLAVLRAQKQAASALVLEAMNALKEGGVLKKWNAAAAEPFQRRNVFLGELKRVGVLNPSGIGVASIREGPRATPHCLPCMAAVIIM